MTPETGKPSSVPSEPTESQSQPEAASAQPGLSRHELNLLEFERNWWSSDQPKEVAVAEKFSLTMAEYLEQIHSVIDRDEALEVDPLLVRRMRRIRDRRRAERAGEMADGLGS